MTAVEWLYEQIKFIDKDTYNQLYEQYQQALEMEKQQHEETFEAGYGYLYTSFEQYYSETYKSNKP
jgi:hypothetical protein